MTIYTVDIKSKAMVNVARILSPEKTLDKNENPTLYQPIKCDHVLNGECKILIQFTNFHYFFDAIDMAPFELKELKLIDSSKPTAALVPVDKLRKWCYCGFNRYKLDFFSLQLKVNQPC